MTIYICIKVIGGLILECLFHESSVVSSSILRFFKIRVFFEMSCGVWWLERSDSLQWGDILRSVLMIYHPLTKHLKISGFKLQCVFTIHDWWIAKLIWVGFVHLLGKVYAIWGLDRARSPSRLTHLSGSWCYLAAQRDCPLQMPTQFLHVSWSS